MPEVKGTGLELNSVGFPSHFIDPKKKESPEYAYQWLTNMDMASASGTASTLFGPSERFNINRAYARAQQSIEKYKPILRVKNRTKKNANPFNYKVLSWEILPILPKFINLLVGRLISQDNSIGVKAVDKAALDERRKTRTNLQEYVLNKPFLQGIEKRTGIKFDSPVEQDVMPEPENSSEVDIFMDMFYKERYCLVLQDLLTLLNDQDNYQEILKECAYDLAEVRVAATKTYRVGKRVKRRRCVPERIRCSSSSKDDFSDVEWIVEDWDLTVGELKEIAGNQFTEAEYMQIAAQAGNQSFNAGVNGYGDYYNQNMCYPWDKTKITISDGVWWSPDTYTSQVKKNSVGNVEVYEKEYSWWKELTDKGVTEKSFNQTNENKVIVQELNNLYQGMWIKGTKFVFNYGKSKDILRNESDIGTKIGPFCLQSLKVCLTEMLIPIADKIQIDWLQYQHLSATTRPSGLDIEFTALQDIAIEGAGGTRITPKEALQLYMDTGILLWRRRDISGNNTNFRPINEIKNEPSTAIQMHFNNILQNIDLLRGLIGENELSDASTPNAEMGKAVANLAIGSNRDAQKYLHFAFDQLNIGTQKRTVMNISAMALSGIAPDYSEAIGVENMSFLALMSDIGVHEYGVYLIKQPTAEIKAVLAKFCDSGILAGTLYEEEAFEIINEPNIYRAIRLMKVYRKRKIEQKRQDEKAQIDYQNQSNVVAAQQAEAAKQQTLQMQAQINEAMAMANAQAEVYKSAQVTQHQIFLKQMEAKLAAGVAITEEEQRRITVLAQTQMQSETQIKVASMKPKPTSSGKK